MSTDPAEDPSPEGRAAREWESVRTALVSRTCAWCGAEVPYSGRGPRPKYCSRAHKQRAYEVRTAERRRADAVQAGQARAPEEPVREVVREEHTRTVLRTYTQEVPVPVPSGPPAVGRAREVQDYLGEIAAAVREGRMCARPTGRGSGRPADPDEQPAGPPG